MFRLSEQNDEPCMFFKFGDAEVSLQFSGIMSEFKLEGTPKLVAHLHVPGSLRSVRRGVSMAGWPGVSVNRSWVFARAWGAGRPGSHRPGWAGQ